MTDPAVTYVRARLRELEAILEKGDTISGQPARGLILPPPDEDPQIKRRMALYRRWLARNAKREETSE